MKHDLSSNMENYLEVILALETRHEHAHIKDIAQEMKIKMPSVTEALRKLKRERLVNYQKYGPITLTKKGRELASDVAQRHRLLYRFLSGVVGVPEQVAEKDACEIEHVISMQTFIGLKGYLNKIGLDK